MLSISLILATCAMGGLLLHAVIQSEAHMPDPALNGNWRESDVLTRSSSVVDHVHACDYRAAELIDQADTVRQIVHEGGGMGRAAECSLEYAGLLEDLAERRSVERRLEIERLDYARNHRAVRAVYRVAGAAA